MDRSRSKTTTTSKKRRFASRSKTPRRKLTYPKNGATRVVAAPSVGLGAAALTKLRTETIASIVTTAGGLFNGYLKPGSAFDPLGDMGSSQPWSYDQWSLLYNRYVVKSAKVTLEFSAAGAITYPYMVAAFPTTTATALGYGAAASMPYAKSCMVGPNDNTTSNTLTFYLDHAKVLGRIEGKVSSEDNGAVVTSDPPATEYMALPISVYFTGASVQTLICRIVVEQTVYFDRRVNVADA
ncbi:MAG: capsid protein [Cressdnaviricota sp.]|nr:MAG: capsid protein [Cressdnaviricota sp.]